MPFSSGNSYASLSLLEHCAHLLVYVTRLQRLHPSAKLRPEATYSEQNLSITPGEGRYYFTEHFQPVTPATASRGGDEASRWTASSRPYPARDKPRLTSRGHSGITTSACSKQPRAAASPHPATCGPRAAFSLETARHRPASRPCPAGLRRGGERGNSLLPPASIRLPCYLGRMKAGAEGGASLRSGGKTNTQRGLTTTRRGVRGFTPGGFYFIGEKKGPRAFCQGGLPAALPSPPDPLVNKSGSP